MRARILAVAVAIAAVAGTPDVRAQAPQTAAPAPGAISGVVTDAITKQPVPGVNVTVWRLSETGQRTINGPRFQTDSKGRFVFAGLTPSDKYVLDAGRLGFASTRYGWTGPNGSSAFNDLLFISVKPGQWVNNLTVPLWRYGSIAGHVIDERGEPVVGVAVRTYIRGYLAGNPHLIPGPIAVTDDRGAYRVANLEAHPYVVAVLSVQSTVLGSTIDSPMLAAPGELDDGGYGASPATSRVAAPTVDVDGRHRLVVSNFVTPPPPGGPARAYPATFYPAALSPGDAATVDIGYGQNRVDVDIAVRPVPAARVSGRVDTGGAPVPSPMLMRLLPAGYESLGFGAEVATTVLEPDGAFTFLNVPAGAYTLLAQASVMEFQASGSDSKRLPDAPGFPGGGIAVGSTPGAPGLDHFLRMGKPASLWARQAVTIADRDLTDLTVPMHQTATVRGRVEWIDGAKPLHPVFAVSPANGDPSLGQFRSAFPAEGAPIEPTFTISGLLGGRYLFEDASVQSVVSDGVDVTNTGLDATTGRDLNDVVITISGKAAKISGVVTQSGAPVVAAVILFPAERTGWKDYGWRPARVRPVRAASDGTYSISNLPGGDYCMIAVGLAQLDAWVDPHFFEAALPAATRISVKRGDTKTQDLTLSPPVRWKQ